MSSKSGLDNPAFEYEMSEQKGKVDKNANTAAESKTLDLDDFEDERCGFGCFSPDWIQPFATKRTFLVVFTVLGVIQGMSWSYFTATISTLEKRFKISTQTAGIVMTGNEMSQIIFSLILSHYGGKGHRPRWIATGVLFSAFSCFVLASPHLFYGSGHSSLILTQEFAHLGDEDLSNFNNSTTPSMFGKASKGKVNLCMRDAIRKGESCDIDEANIVPLILIFVSQFVAGIGVLLFFTLGGPYLDDNTKRTNIPIVFGITMSLRLVGPTIGFLIASACLKLYVNPLLTPLITPEDPRWVGAWWLGWVIFGTCMGISSFFIALFPRRLKRKTINGAKESIEAEPEVPETVPKISEIPKAVKLLLQNKLNVFNNLAGIFYLFSAIGYWTYMPKYMEAIFLLTASSASVVSGLVGILSQASGMILSGFLISRFRFTARTLAAWNVMTAFLYVAVKVSFTQFGCNVGKLEFGTQLQDGTWNLTSTCNYDCNCRTSKILPVCNKAENTVYYSACHAGCTVYENNTISNCACAGPDATLELGNCAEGCTHIFMMFLAISALIKFIDATGRIGNMLISYRCVSLEERSLSIGLQILVLSAFALLPAPIVFGRIIDSVCLVWGGSAGCGSKGNCMLYNGENLRYIFNLTAAAFTFIGGCFDCVVWYISKDLDLYKEPEPLKNDSDKSPEKQ